MPHDMNRGEELPCRGCTPDCPNIHVCDHRPWRCAPGAFPEAEEAGDAGTAAR